MCRVCDAKAAAKAAAVHRILQTFLECGSLSCRFFSSQKSKGVPSKFPNPSHLIFLLPALQKKLIESRFHVNRTLVPSIQKCFAPVTYGHLRPATPPGLISRQCTTTVWPLYADISLLLGVAAIDLGISSILAKTFKALDLFDIRCVYFTGNGLLDQVYRNDKSTV